MRFFFRKDKVAITELVILVVIWLIVLLSPVVVQLTSDEVEWERIYRSWKGLVPFLLLSLFNHFVLFSLLFNRKSKWPYVFWTVITLVIFSFITFQIEKPARPNLLAPDKVTSEMPPPGRPSSEMPPRDRPQPERVQPASPPPQGHMGPRPRRNPKPNPGGLPPYLNTALIALLIVGFDTGLRSVFRWTRSEQERDNLEKEKVKTELAFLRNQINPHFLMNTLNNIHALIDFDTDEAKDTIIRLSKLMRYLLYDTERDLIPLKEEVGFIQSYVELMEMRLSKRVTVSVNMQVLDEHKMLPPLLFTSLIENAFKYGVSNKMDTSIKIELSTTEDELSFALSNTMAQKREESIDYSGIGLENTRKRLEIIYGDSYHLNISTENDIFSVMLKLPL